MLPLEHTLAAVHEELTATMQTLPQYDYEVVLINDCSPDDTIGTIRRLAAADAHVQGVDLAKNFGQHAALMAGFHQCTGDIIVCLDDDGQTPANEVGKLLDKINEGYDVVYASYDNKRQAGWRNLGSWVNSKMTEVMLGKPPELVVNSYFAARRFIVDEMLRYEHCYPYVIGLVLRSTKRIANVLGASPRPGGGTLRLHHQQAAESLDERFYVLFCQAAAPGNLRRHGVCGLWLFVSDLHHHRPLRPRRRPYGLGVYHGAAAVVGWHDPAGAGLYSASASAASTCVPTPPRSMWQGSISKHAVSQQLPENIT